jgi:hypothetical protein
MWRTPFLTLVALNLLAAGWVVVFGLQVADIEGMGRVGLLLLIVAALVALTSVPALVFGLRRGTSASGKFAGRVVIATGVAAVPWSVALLLKLL